MAQAKVSDYFQSKKGCYNPSKKRKLNNEESLSSSSSDEVLAPVTKRRTSERKCKITKASQPKRKTTTRVKQKAQSKLSFIPQKPVSGSVESSEPVFQEVSASKDDHSGSPVSTPSKATSKRPRSNEERDMLQDIFSTPDRGFDFSKSTEKSLSVKKRLILSPKSSAVATSEKKTSEKPVEEVNILVIT